jgi:glutamate-1-semialdehyde 2,1-aminomutase/spore coat polysaccharide biosynthesis protein SpsF
MKKKFEKSINWLKRTKRVIPAASQTFSKSYTQFSVGASPLFLTKGKGAYVWDVDGNKYLDYQMALCPVILGYDYPEVTKAVREQLKKGVSLSLPSPLETLLAEKICLIVPSAEMVRFAKNGSDATSGTIRVARAYTGREIIACCGYHGWQDWYIGTTTRNKGVPRSTKKLTKTFKYNDIRSLEKIFKTYPDKIAAVIMEPMGIEWPKNNFLEKVKNICYKNGALLIFDEIVTGFRLSLGGAQEYFRVIPDLSCFGKSVANGFPLSFVCGKKEIMKEFEEIFFSFTFGGELASIVAALATLKVLEKKPVIKYITEIGYQLQNAYNQLSQKIGLFQHTQAIGYGSRHVINFKNPSTGEEDLLMKTVFQQELVKKGILFGGSNNLSFSHSAKDIEKTIKVYKEILRIIKTGLENNNLAKLVEGKKLEPVFRKP